MAEIYPIDINRKSRKRKSLLSSIKFFAVLLLALFAIGILALNLDVFKVNFVEVRGANTVKTQEILESSDISIGGNLFGLKPNIIKENLKNKYPIIKTVVIKRILPSKILIKIFERRPYACMQSCADYLNNKYLSSLVKEDKYLPRIESAAKNCIFYVIDEERVVLGKFKNVNRKITQKKLIHIRTSKTSDTELGEKVTFSNDKIFKSFSRLVNLHLKDNYKFAYFTAKGITLYLQDGTYVLLGKDSNMEKKIRLIPIFIEELRKAKQEFVGLNLVYLEVPTFIR